MQSSEGLSYADQVYSVGTHIRSRSLGRLAKRIIEGSKLVKLAHSLEQDMQKKIWALASEWGVTAIVAMRSDHVLAEWGETHRPVNVRSVRKSLMNGLYGAALLDHKVELSATLAELDIRDREPVLTDQERQATLRHLLMSRSGVYHGAAYEPQSMKDERPARGSHAPGSFWFYNNWDFNTLGVIYEKITGENIYESFERRIARQIGMEDFASSHCAPAFHPSSDHPAHPFWISARDLARFGLLFLNRGIWQDQEIIPASWIDESLTAHSQTVSQSFAYGYLWWIWLPESPYGKGAHFALGSGGQGLAILPALKLVVAQVVDVPGGLERIDASHFLQILNLIVESEQFGLRTKQALSRDPWVGSGSEATRM
jgi:CubicO group peptidase (beta-lactamase class C family)